MHSQVAYFADAHCRIDVEEQADSVAGTTYVAKMSVLDADARTIRPIVFRDGARAVISGPTEAAAMNSALTYLGFRFGGFSEYPHRIVTPDDEHDLGTPVVVDDGEKRVTVVD